MVPTHPKELIFNEPRGAIIIKGAIGGKVKVFTKDYNVYVVSCIGLLNIKIIF